MNWYVMNVFNGKEKKVKENIEKELNQRDMMKYVTNILIPREKYYQVRKGKKVKSERNYFPGYIMIECEMNGELLRTVKNTQGVISFLGDKTPIPMKESEITNMLGKVAELEGTKDHDLEYDTNLIVGQRVEIVDGPFTTMNGIITKICHEKKKLTVDVNIFNRKTPVELSFEQVNS